MNNTTVQIIALVALSMSLQLGCGDSTDDTSGETTTSNGTTGQAICETLGASEEVAGGTAIHVDEGTTVAYASNPPAIGDHYGAWLGSGWL